MLKSQYLKIFFKIQPNLIYVLWVYLLNSHPITSRRPLKSRLNSCRDLLGTFKEPLSSEILKTWLDVTLTNPI